MSSTKPPTKEKAISFFTLPITTPKEEVFALIKRNRALINAACNCRKFLEADDVEVFERKDNIVITEKGFFIAAFDEDIRNMRGGIDNPIPFKGKDGRMKVEVKKENGEIETTDLATIVAMAWCPNPKKYKHVLFRDGNRENCNGENLIWVSTLKYKIRNFLYSVGKLTPR